MMTQYGKAHINQNGYYVINNGVHINQLLHRLIYEDHHKLTLLSSAIIHHIDGNKLNNSPENLEMINRSEHNKIHHKGKVNSTKTVEKMRKSKMRDNNPMFGTGATGYYRVYKINRPQCRQGFSWVYEHTENGKKKTISRVNLFELEKEVKKRGLEWFKISDEVI